MEDVPSKLNHALCTITQFVRGNKIWDALKEILNYLLTKKRGNRKIGDMTLPPQEKKNEFV